MIFERENCLAYCERHHVESTRKGEHGEGAAAEVSLVNQPQCPWSEKSPEDGAGNTDCSNNDDEQAQAAPKLVE